MLNRSVDFLLNTDEFLKRWKPNGTTIYIKTQHPIWDECFKYDGYDRYVANKCAQRCEQMEETDFAKKCKDDGGLFKCCMR